MKHDSLFRAHLIRHLLATAGTVLLFLVVARFGIGDAQLSSSGESAATAHSSPRPKIATTSVAPQPEITPPPAPSMVTAISPEETLKSQFHGIWMHSDNGDHWIENRPDGTARMLLKLNFVASLVYGKQTHMELTWDLKDGVLTHTVLSGTPTENVNQIIKDYGKSRHYTILEMTPDRMLLLSKTDKEKDLWTRTSAPPEWAKQPMAGTATPAR